jgi:antitoxin component YwqK of YwqJK toxin-antitoxin module
VITILTMDEIKSMENNKPKLTEIKNEYGHCFTDEQGRIQGEYFTYWDNGKIKRQGLYKDDYRHGKLTYYNEDGSIDYIEYFDLDSEISKEQYEKTESLDVKLCQQLKEKAKQRIIKRQQKAITEEEIIEEVKKMMENI